MSLQNDCKTLNLTFQYFLKFKILKEFKLIELENRQFIKCCKLTNLKPCKI